MQQPAMTLIFRPGVIAVLAAATIGAVFLFRHIDRGYVEFTAGDETEAIRLLGERALAGDAFAGLIAGLTVDRSSNTREDVCDSRRFFRLAARDGNPVARSLYVANRLKRDSSPPACRWIRKSLEKLIGTADGIAAAHLSAVLRQEACGNPDEVLALAYLQKAVDLGLAGIGEQLEQQVRRSGMDRDEIRQLADLIPAHDVSNDNWTEILATEPSGFCNFSQP